MSLEIPGKSLEEQDGQLETTLKAALSSVEAGVLLMRLAGKQVKGAENITATVTVPPLVSPNDAKKAKPKSKGRDKRTGSRNMSIDVKDTIKASEEVAHSNGDEVTDLYEEMDENTLSNFREVEIIRFKQIKKEFVKLYNQKRKWDNHMSRDSDDLKILCRALDKLFNMLDQSNTGIITADNLYEELRHVDSEITFSEVEDVLRKVDKDGNGEIDFDEFLFHMIHMGGEQEEGADDEKKKRYTRRKRMLYSAITSFSIKQTLADIEKTFKKQAPHVISHYSAGVRLIGLTTRQLERQMKIMQKDVKKTDSPYAKPLEFVHMGAKALVHKKKIISKDIQNLSRDLEQESKDNENHSDPAVADLSQEIKDTMKLFEHGPNKGPMPDASIIMKLRQKLGSVTAQLQGRNTTTKPENPQPPIILETSVEDNNQLNVPQQVPTTNPQQTTFRKFIGGTRSLHSKKSIQAKLNPSTVKDSKCMKAHLGWTTPRIQYITVPLPSLKMKLESKKPTFNDLYRIRAKAEEATDAYYHNLRQAEIRNAWDHWDRLYADVILPPKLLENFRTVYSAYSPHREEEAFVVCPWKPGPFRYIRHMRKGPVRRLPNSPGFQSGCSSPRVKSQLDNLIVKPISTLQLSAPPSRASSRMS